MICFDLEEFIYMWGDKLKDKHYVVTPIEIQLLVMF